MIIEDFVMLGRTQPVESKKHGVSVCCAGYSVELRKLIRIYPLPWQNYISAGTMCRVPVRRPRDDNRDESWRINAGETADDALSAIEQIGKAPRENEFEFLKQFEAPSIQWANQQRLSLAVINPKKSLRWKFDRRKDIDPAEQFTLFDRLEKDGPLHDSDLIPRLHFSDAGGFHCLQLKEWGCHEWLRNHRENAEQLWDNLKFTDPAYDHLLLVGNQKDRRNSWLVIRTVSRLRETVADMFGFG